MIVNCSLINAGLMAMETTTKNLFFKKQDVGIHTSKIYLIFINFENITYCNVLFSIY